MEKQVLEQIVKTLPTFKKSISVSSIADTVTSIACPGIQAYASANTEPVETFPKTLLFPQISLQDMITMPDSTIPMFSVILPSERIVSPFYNFVLPH